MNDNKVNLGTVGLSIQKIENVEYVFQFNNDEPIHLDSASLTDRGTKKVTFTIANTTHSNIVFNDGKGNTFKIFAREKGGNK